MRDAHSAHMDVLLKRIDQVLEDEDAADAMHVLAVACAWSAYQHEKRELALEALITVIRAEFGTMKGKWELE
jgi:hypothetical protein